MDRLSPQLLLSIEERIALTDAINELCGSRIRRSTYLRRLPASPKGKHAVIIFSLSVVSLVATHAMWISTGY